MQRLGGLPRRVLSALRLLPPGGASGQVLKKASATDYDATWQAEASADPNALKSNVTATLSAGFKTTSYSLGTITGAGQSISPNEADGQHQHCTLNGSSLTGTLTVNPPNASTQVVLEVTNGGSGAVAATLSIGTTWWDGIWVPTNGFKFLFVLTRTQNYSHCQIIPLQ